MTSEIRSYLFKIIPTKFKDLITYYNRLINSTLILEIL